MRLIPRSIVALILTTLTLLIGCSHGGTADNCIDQVSSDMRPSKPTTDMAELSNVFAGDLTLSCTGRSLNGQEVWVFTPLFTRGGGPNFDLIPIWVPSCRKVDNRHICAAPVTREGQDWAGTVTCYIVPCRGLQRDRINWVDFRNGNTVVPSRFPSNFPQARDELERFPKGGGDACSDPQYGWEFLLTE